MIARTDIYDWELCHVTVASARTWAEVHLGHLAWNVEELRKRIPPACEFMAVVKADAYGHGAIRVAQYLQNRCKVRAFAVATLDEGLQLRQNGIRGEILILGYTDPEHIKDVVAYEMIQTVVDETYATILNHCGQPIKVHLKIDTGMNRLGESYEHTEQIENMFRMKNLRIEGMYTHLCVPDSMDLEDIAFTQKQMKHFREIIEKLGEDGYKIPKVHMLSSYGIINYPQGAYDYVRAGILMYGVYSKEECDVQGEECPGKTENVPIHLKPVMELRTRIAGIKEIAAGTSVSYGRSFVAPKRMKVATLTIGYADGIPRNISSKDGSVLIHGKRAPIIGRVCMDQMIVDVTEIPQAAAGDTVTIIGRDGKEEIRAEEVAKWADTITNELFSRIGRRVEIRY